MRAAQRQFADAGKLCGAADALLELMHTQMHPFDQEHYQQKLAALRAELDQAAFDAALAEGRALTLEQAIDLALKEMVS